MPDWKPEILRRLASLKLSPAREGEIAEELAQHLDDRYQDLLAAGSSADSAFRAALDELREDDFLARSLRPVGRDLHREPISPGKDDGNCLSGVLQDIRYAVHMLRKSPGFAAIAILTLALGIGANTAIFTILNSAALRLLPVPDADQLVTVGQNVHSANGGPLHRNIQDDDSFVSYSEYRAYAKENRVFSGLLAYSAFTETTLVHNKPEPIMGTLASCNYFDVLEIRPERGRFFADSDCAGSGESAVVILSDSAWHSTFAGDPAIVGKNITLNRTPFRVIGVAPPGF
ncbi:MAG TPA: ABC transporter permease, partial [Candidatus Cybelea sp.]|nr:ABC transporter permease [Candidatus Cybelea sp.]